MKLALSKTQIMHGISRNPVRLEETVSYKLARIQTMSQLGFKVFPVNPRSKMPAIKDWRNRATANLKKALKHFEIHSEQNYGVVLGDGVFLVDVDGAIGKASLAALVKANTKLPPTLIVNTPGGGWHLYYRASPGSAVRNSVGRLGKGIDIRGEGGYGVGPGSVHPNGVIYRLRLGKAGGKTKIALAPNWLLEKVRDTKSIRAEQQVTTSAKIPASQRGRAEAFARAACDRECERLQKAPNHQRNNTLNLCAFQLGQLVAHSLLNAKDVGRRLLRIAQEIGLERDESIKSIRSGLDAGRKHPRSLTFLSQSRAGSPARPIRSRDGEELTQSLAKLGTTDTDNATRFARRFGSKVLYSKGHGWMLFDGRCWRPDAYLECIELAKRTARAILQEARFIHDNERRKKRVVFSELSKSKASLDRMLDLAKGLVLVPESRLDADPWLLNTLTGTIDLKSGMLHPHDPRDLLTKIAPVAANMDAQCPQFEAFLNRIMGNDPLMVAYIQRAVGYTLTGEISEQCFFYCRGEGMNGKSALVNLVRELLGDYGIHTPTETLLVKQFDNAIPADLARLAGARMVTAIESNFNRQLDEARVKAMTGGEPITARFMRNNFFQFRPQFKLWFVANDFLRVRATAKAFWRRPHLISFNVEIPQNERDKDFAAKLIKAEASGILAWAVRGCLEWQRIGLSPPPAVMRATDAWREGLDTVGRFLNECVISEPGSSVTASGMYSAFKKWCDRHGEQPMSIKEFKSRLQEKDVTHKRLGGGARAWIGVKLRH